MNVYLAGPLFTQAERHWNLQLARLMEQAGHHVFLPQVEVQSIELLDAETIFQLDVSGVRGSDVVVAILDGADPDSGTSFECGLAYGLGIPIVIVRTDFRAGGDSLPGQKLATVNLMLSQAGSVIIALPDPASTLAQVGDAVVKVLADLNRASHL
jgi:nucleoside 2-deoxyribosyltransferase